MSEREPIYNMRVLSLRGEQLVQIAGTRATVIDVALRVLLDAAPRWEAQTWGRPPFQVDVWRIDP